MTASKLNVKEISAKALRLPLSTSGAEVAEYFLQFEKPIEVVHEYCEEDGFTSIHSGNRLAIIQLDEGVDKTDVPHVTGIAGFPALISIAGRQMSVVQLKWP